MADLITTLSESVTLNGSVRGSTNTVTTNNVVDVMERIVTSVQRQVTTIATFAAAPYTSPGAIDVARTKYIRVTNLSATEVVDIGVVTTNTNYQVVLTAGNSHILCQADTTAIGEADTDPAFGTLENITSIEIKPRATTDTQVELCVGLI